MCPTVWVIVAETEEACVSSYLMVWYLGGQGFSQHRRRQVRPAASRVGQVVTTWKPRADISPRPLTRKVRHNRAMERAKEEEDDKSQGREEDIMEGKYVGRELGL